MAGQRQFDEQQALRRALKVFWSKGYGATSMQDIALATGVLRGSLYNAYHDKETLFVRVFEGYADDFISDSTGILAHPDVEQALVDLFDYSVDSMTRGTPPRGCLTTKTAVDTRADGDRIEAALRDLLDRLEEVVRERLSQDDATARLVIPPAEAARVVVTMTRGTVVMNGVYQDPDRLRATARAFISVCLSPRPAMSA